MADQNENVQLGPRPLFGGAITMDLPVQYGDASDLRQIPDNQEVFLSPNSDTSIVIEVLAMVEDGLASTDLWEAVKFHFASIAHDNAALNSTISTPPPLDTLPSQPLPLEGARTPSPVVLTGTQEIHKYSHDPTGAPRPGHETDIADRVFIGVALWRIWLEGGGRSKKADLVCSANVNLSAVGGEEERKQVEHWWAESIPSLSVGDWQLFGDA